MSIANRLGWVALAVLLLGACLATFLPTSPDGAECGTWVAPEWSDETADDMIQRNRDIYEDAARIGEGQLAAEAVGRATAIRETKTACDDALGTRRTVTAVLFGAALVAPLAIWFVAGGARRRP